MSSNGERRAHPKLQHRSAGLVALVLALSGCAESSYRLKPAAPMATRMEGVEVEVEALELLPRNASEDDPAPEDHVRVVLRLTNHTSRILPFDATRLAIARLDRPGRVGTVGPVIPEPTPSATALIPETNLGEIGADLSEAGAVLATGAAAVLVAGTRLGVIVPRPRREWVGHAVDAAAAVAIAAVVLPIEVVLAIDREMRRPPDRFDPGHTVRFAVDLGALPISGAEDYALLLGSSLGLAPGAVTLPITDPLEPHGGFRPPSEHQALGFRFAGGAAHLPGADGVVTEAQLYTGWKVLGLTIGPMFSVPVLSFGAGLQARWSPRVTAHSRIDASLSYEGRNLFHSDLGWTHGPVLGIDVLWSLETHSALGWPVATSHLGLFVRGGPVVRNSDVGALWQAGLAYVY